MDERKAVLHTLSDFAVSEPERRIISSHGDRRRFVAHCGHQAMLLELGDFARFDSEDQAVAATMDRYDLRSVWWQIVATTSESVTVQSLLSFEAEGYVNRGLLPGVAPAPEVTP